MIAQDKASNSNLKIEALVFTRLVMASHSSAVFHPHIKVLNVEAPPSLSSTLLISADWYLWWFWYCLPLVLLV